MSDFLPTAPLSNLQLRSRLLRRLREFFHEHGFWEVETPLLSSDTVIDRHLDPIPVVDPIGRSRRTDYWLQTSPEFGMKRLLAAGATSIYQVTRAFRRDEIGPLHNPEFTIVEWYRVGDDRQAGIQLLSDLAEVLLNRGPADRSTYAEVFEDQLGLDPHQATPATLRSKADQLGLVWPASFAESDRDAWLDLLMAEKIQPMLGRERPMILDQYPSTQAALAQVRDGDSSVAERFELFDRGVELANGYHELLDPRVLEDRQRLENRWRRQNGKPALPEQNRLVEAMRAGLPPCAGVALGFDRLAMLVLGAKSLSEVIAFPFDRA